MLGLLELFVVIISKVKRRQNMQKYFVFLFLLVIVISFSENLEDFLYNYMVDLYNVPCQIAELITPVIIKDSEEFGLDPLLMTAIFQHETRFKNVYGDGGDAVGIPQLHQNAVYYVCAFYPEIREKVKEINGHANLIKYPVLQVQIAIRYFYLIQRNLELSTLEAIGRYNGREEAYNIYTAKVISEYASILLAYEEYKITTKSQLPTTYRGGGL